MVKCWPDFFFINIYKGKIGANEKIEFLINITVDIDGKNYTEVSNIAQLFFTDSTPQ